MLIRLIPVLILIGFLCGCASDSPTEPTHADSTLQPAGGSESPHRNSVPVKLWGDGPIRLAVGESVMIEQAGLLLTFVEVDGDSRCPLSVHCFWEGVALVVIHAESTDSGRQEKITLHTTDRHDFSTTGEILGREISLNLLEPYPINVVNGMPHPDSYSVVLTLNE